MPKFRIWKKLSHFQNNEKKNIKKGALACTAVSNHTCYQYRVLSRGFHNNRSYLNFMFRWTHTYSYNVYM